MYTILVTDDNRLMTTNKERIIQRSKLVDNFWFLVKPEYNGCNMADCTVLLEYLRPVSKRYETEILNLSEETYNGYLKYELPINTEFTEEAGELELQLSFIYVDLDAEGNSIQKVRKTAPVHKVDICPISAWSDVIPDSTLTAVDQRLIMVNAQIKAIEEMQTAYNNSKADNITYDKDKNELQLMAGSSRIGNTVTLNTAGGGFDEDGLPVVDFSGNIVPPQEDDGEEESNVVEF